MILRPAATADIDALVALEASFPAEDRFDRRTWRRLLSGHAATLVAAAPEAPDQLLGAAVMLYRRGLALARLYSITVAPAARGKGVARALMAACEADATARGARAVRLEVRSSNSSAIRLYEAGGYRVIATLESYYPDGEAALRMEKCLNAPSNGAP
ncbi:GNAT family N-acetyltransferase [Hyphomonas sp. WL0036]|uniref:GNAT family N-acetyltransferase n=1 Tax=Hyphomonas sediminis TaxID=2866160 RepID=UPI001C80A05C|nr:N-acetyltransferase [Hyphomonas sediminis]MBY9068260.1 GNAT family N-acetyltransferase [Hyphomonas sediminis]